MDNLVGRFRVGRNRAETLRRHHRFGVQFLDRHQLEAALPGAGNDGILIAADVAFSSYDLAVRCFLSSNVEPTNEIIDGESLIEDLYRQLAPLPLIGGEGSTSLLAHIISIRESIKRISQCNSDIAELTIDRAYKVKK